MLPTRRSLARWLAPCLAVGACLSLVAPMGTASADTADHRLARARAHAAQLDAKARQQASAVAAGRARLAALDAQANSALAALQAASLYAARMQAAQLTAQAAADAAARQTDVARTRLAALAANAYRSQASGGSFAATLALLRTGDPATLMNGLNLLDEVGKTQSGALDDLALAEARQARAEQQAAQAATAASAAQAAAASAKGRADALASEQQQAVAALDQALAATRAAAKSAHADAAALARAIAAARARAAAIRRAQELAAGKMPVAGCDGSSVAGYPNGELPTRALCPLWQAPGQMLQAGAAAAFNRMSHAFAGAFGEPLCVTASYRTYQRQVELYATMPPGYAAVPGTSNHGWALAVDLCGGIQVDNSPEHQWLLDHAAAYSWFHPAWAEPGGAGPHEPWHWEYAG